MSQDTPQALPEKMSADDLDHQRYLVAQREAAEIAMDSWGRYVMNKYRLTIHDGVAPDGTIVRNAEQSQNGAVREIEQLTPA